MNYQQHILFSFLTLESFSNCWKAKEVYNYVKSHAGGLLRSLKKKNSSHRTSNEWALYFSSGDQKRREASSQYAGRMAH